MDKYTINFTESSNKLAYIWYQALLKQGVLGKEIDQGHSVINYGGIHCQDKQAKSCIKGAGDHIIDAQEVCAYVLNNYERFQKLIATTMRGHVPWVLDDFDPKTNFDTNVRKRVYATIAEVRRLLKEKRVPKGTIEYQNKLATAIYCFGVTPDVEKLHLEVVAILTNELKKAGLLEFKKYLDNNRGLAPHRFDLAGLTVYDALNALERRSGRCTERSEILFAILKMAGFSPFFVSVDPRNLVIDDPRIRARIRANSQKHICVGLKIGDKIRLFEPNGINSNANYAGLSPAT